MKICPNASFHFTPSGPSRVTFIFINSFSLKEKKFNFKFIASIFCVRFSRLVLQLETLKRFKWMPWLIVTWCRYNNYKTMMTKISGTKSARLEWNNTYVACDMSIATCNSLCIVRMSQPKNKASFIQGGFQNSNLQGQRCKSQKETLRLVFFS